MQEVSADWHTSGGHAESECWLTHKRRTCRKWVLTDTNDTGYAWHVLIVQLRIHSTFDFIPLRLTLSHYVWLYPITFDFIPLCLTLFHYVWLYPIMFDFIPLRLTVSHYVWLYPITFDFIPLCLTLFHYVWLYPITFDFIPLQLTLSHYVLLWLNYRTEANAGHRWQSEPWTEDNAGHRWQS